MNDLITVPEFGTVNMGVIVKVNTYKTNVLYSECGMYMGIREVDKKITEYFFRYIGGLTAQPYDTKLVKHMSESPFEVFERIKKLCHRNGIKDLEMFYKLKYDKFYPPLIPYNFESLYYYVEYYELREEIIPFLQQTLGDIHEVNDLKSWFVCQGNCKSFREYLFKKTKYLLGIDLESYLDIIIKEQSIRIKEQGTQNEKHKNHRTGKEG